MATNPLHSIARAINKIPGIGLLQVGPKTAEFMVKAWLKDRRVPIYPEPPAPKVTPGMAVQVALDEAFLGAMKSPSRYPRRLDYSRVSDEVRQAHELYGDRGWLEQPLGYHRAAPPLSAADVDVIESNAVGQKFLRLSWDSGFEPHPDEPGRDRWADFTPNHRAYAWLRPHPGPDAASRPWLVCVHGFGMGSPFVDFHGFRAGELQEQLGVNLAFPVLPLHGPRKTGRMSGSNFMSFDFMHAIFGLAQTVHDTRRLVGYLQAEHGATRFGLYGLSLGSYAGSLIVSVDDRFDAVLAGIPASDIPRLFRHHTPTELRRRAVQHGLLGAETHEIHRVVSPLALPPLVPKDKRAIFAGLGDRMSTPKQAQELWTHWDRPRIEWYNGTHVGFMLSSQVGPFALTSLRDAGIVHADAPALAGTG